MKIIKGFFKGYRIPAASLKKTRPTSSLVREAYFDIVNPWVRGCSFFDLFSGTGAMGLEALSHGAKQVVFCEKDKRLAVHIGDIFKQLVKDFDANHMDYGGTGGAAGGGAGVGDSAADDLANNTNEGADVDMAGGTSQSIAENMNGDSIQDIADDLANNLANNNTNQNTTGVSAAGGAGAGNTSQSSAGDSAGGTAQNIAENMNGDSVQDTVDGAGAGGAAGGGAGGANQNIAKPQIFSYDWRRAVKTLYKKDVRFSLIYADPPYSFYRDTLFFKTLMESCLKLLKDKGLMTIEISSQQAHFYLKGDYFHRFLNDFEENSKRYFIWEKRYGSTHLLFFGDDRNSLDKKFLLRS